MNVVLMARHFDQSEYKQQTHLERLRREMPMKVRTNVKAGRLRRICQD